MASRNYITWSHSILSCVLLFVVVVLLNVVMARASMRLDLTEEGLYTLDEGSRNILEGMRDPVALTVFWGNVPKQTETAKRHIEAMLDDMAEVAGDKLTVRWVDTDTEEGEEEAKQNNIRSYVYRRIEGNARVEASGYMTLLFESGAREPMKIDDLGLIGPELEVILLGELEKRSRVNTPTIALANPDSPLFLTNRFGNSREGGRFNMVKQILRQRFGGSFQELQSLEQPIPPNVAVLVVMAPWKLPEIASYHIEQFALGGGRVVLLMDAVNVENTLLDGQEREPRTSGLEDWLAHVGITVEYGLVGDFNAQNRSECIFVKGEQGPYPYWPLVTQDNMDTDNVVMRSIRAMPMVWPSAITIDDARQKEGGRTANVLARTSSLGHRRAEIGDVAKKLSHPLPITSELESVPLLVMVEGPLTSMWKGKPKPKTPAEIAAEAAEKAEAERKAAEEAAKKEAEGAEGAEKEAASGTPDGDAPAPAPGDDKPPAPADGEAPAPGDGEAPAPGDGEAPAPGDDKPPAPSEDDKPAGGDGGDGDEDGGDDDGEDGGEDGGDAEADEEQGPPRLDEGKVKILIAGDAEFCADYMWRDLRFRGDAPPPNGRGGFALVVSLSDWLSGSEDLISLRSRDTNPRKLEVLEPSEQKTVQLLNVSAIPFLLLCAGFVVFAVRRSQRS